MSKLLVEAYDVSAHFNNGEDPDILRVNGKMFYPAIMCMDCKHWDEYMSGLGKCDKLKTDTGELFYCKYGEPKVTGEVKDERR